MHSIVDVAENVLPSVDRGVESSLPGFICDKTLAHFAHLQSTVQPPRSRVYFVSCVGCLPACCYTLFLNLGLFGGELALHFMSVE